MDSNPRPVTLRVDAGAAARAIALLCIGCELVIVALDAAIAYGGAIDIPAIRRLVNITREDSFPNWFSCTQLFVVGLVLWLLYFSAKQARSSRYTVFGWFVLAAFFSYMALDDGSMLHERIGTASKDVVDELEKFPSYAWQAVLGPLFIGMGIFMALFLWREFPQRIPRLLLMGAIGCYALAMGLDFLEQVEDGPYSWIMQATKCSEYTVSHFAKSLEETLENVGTTLFLVTFFVRFTRGCERIEFEPTATS